MSDKQTTTEYLALPPFNEWLEMEQLSAPQLQGSSWEDIAALSREDLTKHLGSHGEGLYLVLHACHWPPGRGSCPALPVVQGPVTRPSIASRLQVPRMKLDQSSKSCSFPEITPRMSKSLDVSLNNDWSRPYELETESVEMTEQGGNQFGAAARSLTRSKYSIGDLTKAHSRSMIISERRPSFRQVPAPRRSRILFPFGISPEPGRKVVPLSNLLSQYTSEGPCMTSVIAKLKTVEQEQAREIVESAHSDGEEAQETGNASPTILDMSLKTLPAEYSPFERRPMELERSCVWGFAGVEAEASFWRLLHISVAQRMPSMYAVVGIMWTILILLDVTLYGNYNSLWHCAVPIVCFLWMVFKWRLRKAFEFAMNFLNIALFSLLIASMALGPSNWKENHTFSYFVTLGVCVVWMEFFFLVLSFSKMLCVAIFHVACILAAYHYNGGPVFSDIILALVLGNVTLGALWMFRSEVEARREEFVNRTILFIFEGRLARKEQERKAARRVTNTAIWEEEEDEDEDDELPHLNASMKIASKYKDITWNSRVTIPEMEEEVSFEEEEDDDDDDNDALGDNSVDQWTFAPRGSAPILDAPNGRSNLGLDTRPRAAASLPAVKELRLQSVRLSDLSPCLDGAALPSSSGTTVPLTSTRATASLPSSGPGLEGSGSGAAPPAAPDAGSLGGKGAEEQALTTLEQVLKGLEESSVSMSVASVLSEEAEDGDDNHRHMMRMPDRSRSEGMFGGAGGGGLSSGAVTPRLERTVGPLRDLYSGTRFGGTAEEELLNCSPEDDFALELSTALEESLRNARWQQGMAGAGPQAIPEYTPVRLFPNLDPEARSNRAPSEGANTYESVFSTMVSTDSNMFDAFCSSLSFKDDVLEEDYLSFIFFKTKRTLIVGQLVVEALSGSQDVIALWEFPQTLAMVLLCRYGLICATTAAYLGLSFTRFYTISTWEYLKLARLTVGGLGVALMLVLTAGITEDLFSIYYINFLRYFMVSMLNCNLAWRYLGPWALVSLLAGGAWLVWVMRGYWSEARVASIACFVIVVLIGGAILRFKEKSHRKAFIIDRVIHSLAEGDSSLTDNF